MLRNLMLTLAANRALIRFVSSLGGFGLAQRFVAGKTLESAMDVVRSFNHAGLWVTLDLLGEGVLEGTQATQAATAYRQLLHDIDAGNVRSNISIKLTQIGLDISPDLCAENLRPILDTARQLNNFVRIDMEGSDYTQATVDVFKDSFREYGPHVGIVIQSYLYRSEADIRELSQMGCNIRLCKGAYMEPPEVAFPKKKDVDANFAKLLEILLTSPAYSAIATHDEKMIAHARDAIAKAKVANSKYEFQMLYGVRRDRQLSLYEEGFKVRVYVPFGRQWAPYFMRRMAERPANLLFILRSLVRG